MHRIEAVRFAGPYPRIMRMLAACSLGGVGHLNPLLPFLAAAERLGDDVVVAGC